MKVSHCSLSSGALIRKQTFSLLIAAKAYSGWIVKKKKIFPGKSNMINNVIG